MSREKILIVTDWYEPGFKAGGPIQSCRNIVRELSERYEFYILTSDRDLGDKSPYPGIICDKWISLDNKVKIWYASAGKMTFSVFSDLIRKVSPHTVYFNSMFSQKYTLLPLLVLFRMKFHGEIIIAPRGMLHRGAMVRKTLKKKIFLKLIDILRLTKNIHFHATNEHEAKDIRKYFKRIGAVTVVENIPNADPDVWQERRKGKGQLNCVFISRIHPKKNLHFAIQTMLDIKAGCKIQFDIYGVIDDKSYAHKCEQLAKRSGNNVEINFKGIISREELFVTLKKYHLFVLPTLGENFGHVIFEALSSGCPVLISDQTNWADVSEFDAGWALRLNGTEKFTERIAEVCQMDEAQFNKKSRSAYDYSRTYISQQNLVDKYIQLFG